MGKEETKVRAEVLLRNSQAEAIERVSIFLRGHGIEVTAVGAASLSIRCDPAVFEALFKTRLERAAPGRPVEGVRDRGRLRHAAFRALGPIVVPEAIGEDVAGIHPQESASLL